MKRREFIKKTGFAGVSAFAFKVVGKTIQRPNLLFIMTDQQRWDAMSCAGNTILQTLNLDRLAQEGVRFGLCNSQCPVCGPARASMLTGCCIETTQCRTNMDALLDHVEAVRPLKTYDEILIDSGYNAEYYGKWHAPNEHSTRYRNGNRHEWTQEYLRFLQQNYPAPPMKAGQLVDSTWSRYPYTPNPLDARYAAPGDPESKLTRPLAQPDCHGISEMPLEGSATAFQGQQTLDALDRLNGAPFSLTCSFHFPHSPILPVHPYADLFDPKEMPIPVSLHDPMTNNPYIDANGRRGMPEYSDPNKIKYMISNYYALVKEVDDWIGKILNKLDDLGLTENTLVIFTSDHGEMLGAHGMREKNVFLEESVRVPLLMRFPGRIKPRSVVSASVSHIDLFATINDYMGSGTHFSNGESLRRYIEGEASKADPFAVAEWHWPNLNPANIMIRTAEWKLMMPYDPASKSPAALFNLKDDPYEMTNLIGSNPQRSSYEQQVESLRAQLVSWCERVNHPYTDHVKNRPLL